jgi:2-polyprenyl-3-methyl-5-hydroxy-6-metoxy-1,4-benzoquinol methylase
MSATDDAAVSQHNQYQRAYFEGAQHGTLKPTGSVYLRRHVAQMMRFAGIKPGDRVLEVGCGLGRYTFILAEQGVAVEGLDLSTQLVQRLDEINAGRYDIPLHAHDLVDSPAEMYGRYDAVIGFFVLHHVHDLHACLQVATRLARPGGRVAFLEPNPLNPLYYVQITFTPEMKWEGEKGIFKMRQSIMTPSMQAAGLSDVSCQRFGFLPPFVINTPFGERLESILESVPVWEKALPFQLFAGSRISAEATGPVEAPTGK